MDLLIGIGLGMLIVIIAEFVFIHMQKKKLRKFIDEIESILCHDGATDAICNAKSKCRNTRGLPASIVYEILDIIQKKL